MEKCYDKHCEGCRFYRKIWDEMWYCAYIFVKDKRRPCPPGKDCTVKVKRKVRK